MRETFDVRYGLILVLALVGVTISGAVFKELLAQRRETVSLQFERAAADRARVIEQAFTQQVKLLDAASAYVTTVPGLTRAQFKEFALTMLDHHVGALALSWNPRVPHARRSEFEEDARRELPEFRITERSESGELRPAQVRDEYYTVKFIEPLEANRSALGFDLGSQLTRRDAVWRARDSGRAVSSGRISLVQDRETQPGLLLMEPVYRGSAAPETVEGRRKQFLGIVVVPLHVRDLVASALAVLDPGGVDLALFDENGSDDGPLYTHASRTRAAADGLPDGLTFEAGPLIRDWRFELAAHRWRIAAAPAPGYYSLAVPLEAWGILFGGCMLTLMICLVIERLVHRSRRLERERERLERHIAKRTVQLEEANRTLLRQDRLAAVGQLMSTVAHELRNPLSTITTTFEVLRRRIPASDDPVQHAIDRIDRSVKRCNNVIDDLLSFTRGREAVLEPVDADRWIQSVLRDYVLPDGVDFRCDLDASDVRVALDRELMHRAIANLLDNAFQALEAGSGEDRAVTAPRVRLSTRLEGENLVVEIEDDGVGMEPEMQQQIFEPLFSTKPSGTGLGLPVVVRVVEQHHGTLRVESERGRGTRIALTLPVASGRDGAAQEQGRA